MKLEEITDNLKDCVDRYNNLSLTNDLHELSEILRDLGVNLSALVQHRNDAYRDWHSVYYNSQGKTNAAKEREADNRVQELYYIRQIHKYYGEMRNDIRSQISLHKKHD